MAMPSWFPDPMHRHELRWWDGDSWTAHVNDQGVPSEDPLFGSDPEHPGWGPPTVTPSGASHPAPPPVAPSPPPPPLTAAAPTAVAPLVAATGTPPPTSTSRRPLLIVGGIVAVVAIGVGVFFATRGGGDSTSIGLVPSMLAITVDPDVLRGLSERKSSDGLFISLSPLSVISKTPISLVAPNLFFTVLRMRKGCPLSPSK